MKSLVSIPPRTRLVVLAVAATLAAWQLTAAEPETNANSCPMGMACCGGSVTPTAVKDSGTNAIPDHLKTCPVSGEKLGGDMGKPYVFEYKGQEVKLCCKGCKKDFLKEPAKYLKLIRAADKK